MKQQIDSALKLYGTPLRTRLVQESSPSPELERRVYITIHEESPLVWSFVSYRAKQSEDWTLLAVDFSDDFDKLDWSAYQLITP